MKVKAGDLKKIIKEVKKPKVVGKVTVGELKAKIQENKNKSKEKLDKIIKENTILDVSGLIQAKEEVYDFTNVINESKSKLKQVKNNKPKVKPPTKVKVFEMTKKEAALLINKMVKEVKAEGSYTNLKFVDEIGSKYLIPEGYINEIKNTIKVSKTYGDGSNLYKFLRNKPSKLLKEGLKKFTSIDKKPEEVLPKLFESFNKTLKENSKNKAIVISAEKNNVPKMLVKELHDLQVYSLKNNIKDTKSLFEGCYNKWQKMKKGDISELYDEIAEMMDYQMAENQDGMYGMGGYDDYAEEKYGMPDEDEWESEEDYIDSDYYDDDYEDVLGIKGSDDSEKKWRDYEMDESDLYENDDFAWDEDMDSGNTFRSDNGVTYRIEQDGNKFMVTDTSSDETYTVMYSGGELKGVSVGKLPNDLKRELIDVATGDEFSPIS